MDERSGGIYCAKCRACINPPRKRKHYRPETTMLCVHCHDEKFPDVRFSLHHLGNDRWIIKNEQGQSWCGQEGWVHPNSSHFQLTADCLEVVFAYWQVIDFVANSFETSLKEL